MKKIRYLAIFIAILAIFVLAAPAMASPTAAGDYPIVKGIEVFPGIDFANINWGATFVAQVNGPYNATLSASIDYQGYNPVPNGTNAFVGGCFTLTATQFKNSVIKGKLNNDGYVTWSGGAGTDSGHVVMPTLKILSATGVFQGITGGSFDGTDNHVSGLVIFGITVPTVSGTLKLN
jgi:hypothetical protein